MNDFVNILTHGRRLQGATKSLSLDELLDVQEKLASVIEKRREQLVAEQAELEEKKAKIEAIRQQMIEAGLDISDFDAEHNLKPKQSRRKGQKRPVRYVITKDGQETEWTGIGRMPLVFRDVLESGGSLEDYAV
ncbi:MAG: H-NS histone family protein [Alteromonadaceae bacterium]|nr:H-NS histone family protein [Alteromonadaceae bacterium]